MTDKNEALRLAALIETTAARRSLRDQVAVELRRQHAELETLRTGYSAARLEIESLKAQLKEHADELTVAYMCGASREKELAAQQPGAAYAELPDAPLSVFSKGPWTFKETGQNFSGAELDEAAFVAYRDRASHGQAPAKAAPAAVTGPSGYGPKVTVKRSCSDCKACNSESYAVQGDSGHYVYCEHPSLPERKYIGDTHWDTPDWCPAAAPTAHPASQQEAGKAVHQFRKQHCADWYDGRADHGDSGGPYEERTLYTVPQPAARGDAPAMPSGWVSCTIEFDGSGPEEVAYGPKIMMDRLAKWLGKHFERTIAEKAAPQPVAREPLTDSQAQAGAVPMSHDEAKALVRKYGNDPLHLVLQVERHHGIKGGQHGADN